MKFLYGTTLVGTDKDRTKQLERNVPHCHLITYLLSYLLTPRSRVVLEKLIGFQLVKKFHAFYWTRMFVTTFTSASHLSLSKAKISVHVWGTCSYFVTKPVCTVRSCQQLAQTLSRRTASCRLSTTAYSMYSQLPFILEAVPPSATWGCAMPWWQEPTCHGQGLLKLQISQKPIFKWSVQK